MPIPADPVKIHAIMADLGVSPRDFQALQGMPLEVAQRRLDELKAIVAKNYRRLAFAFHPDRNPGNTVAEATFKLLGTVKSDIDNLKVQPAPPMPRPQMRIIRVVTWTSAGTAYTTANATSPTMSVRIGVPFRVATMRPT